MQGTKLFLLRGILKIFGGSGLEFFFNNFIAVCVVVFKPQLVYRPVHVHLVLLHHWSYSGFINLYKFILCFLHHWSVWVLCHWLRQWYRCFAYWCWGHGDGLLLLLLEGGVEIISNVCAFYIYTCFFLFRLCFLLLLFILCFFKKKQSHIHEHNINYIVLQNLKNKIVNMCLL